MIVRKCDRCGVCYEPYRDNGKHKVIPGCNGVAFVHIKTDGKTVDGNNVSIRDLCPACLDAVIKFIDGGVRSE